jgi:hypothetical protein
MKHMKQSKPTEKIRFDDVLAGVVVIQTVNLDGKTFAWLDDDGRFLSTVDGIGRHEDVAKEWFVEWFDVRPEHEIKLMSFDRSLGSSAGRTFVVRIRQSNVSA